MTFAVRMLIPLFGLLLRGGEVRAGTGTPDIKEWAGVYPFDQFFEPDLSAEYRIVVADGRGKSQIILNGTHETCARINATAKPAGRNQLNIYYESAAFGCEWQEQFSKGDLLVSLVKLSKGYILRWRTLHPLGDSTERPHIYRDDQIFTENGRKIEGPYAGEGFFSRLSPAGVCGYDLQYLVFYNLKSKASAVINDALRTALIPSEEAMKKCDEAHRNEPKSDQGVSFAQTVRDFAWINGGRIGSVQVQQFERASREIAEMSQSGLTFDLETGRFFEYSDLFRPESRDQVDYLIFAVLAGKMKRVGIDYPWEQFLKDKKETYQFCLWSKSDNPRLITLRILDFPSDWFKQRVNGGQLEPELPLDQIKSYANPDGPLALLALRK